MFKNYFLTAIRFFKRNKSYVILNVLCLSVALLVCLLSALYIQDEYSFDSFHPKLNRTFIPMLKWKQGGIRTFSPSGFSEKIQKELPLDVEAATSVLMDDYSAILNIKEKKIRPKIHFIDANFGEVFNFRLVQGNIKTALKNKNSIILSEKVAKKYFGSTQILNQKILFKWTETKEKMNWDTLRVTGIIEDCPANSTIQYEILMASQKFMELGKVGLFKDLELRSSYFTTFIVLKKQADITKIKQIIVHQYLHKWHEAVMKSSLKQIYQDVEKKEIILHPWSDVYLYQPTNYIYSLRAIEKASRWEYSMYLGLISLSILFISSFNFTNLSIAQNLIRSKEVGIRKIIGATKRHLMYQFLFETFFLCLIAIVLAGLMSLITLPFFSYLTEKHLTLDWFSNLPILLLALVLLFFSALLAGIYPAWLFSNFSPAQIFKNKQNIKSTRRINFLISLQFTIVSLFMIVTWVMNWQIQSFKAQISKNLQKDILLYVNGKYDVQTTQIKKIQAELSKIKGVLGITRGYGRYGGYKGKIDGVEYKSIFFEMADEDYFSTINSKIIKGVGFDKIPTTNKNNYPAIVDESFAKRYKINNPLGKKIQIDSIPGYTFKVVGICEDFYPSKYGSSGIYLYPVEGSSFAKGGASYMLRIQADKYNTIIPQIKKYYEQLFPDYLVDIRLVETHFDETLVIDKMLTTLLTIATFIAIFIAFFGIVGVVAFEVNHRTKEIGIRKTMGASERAILYLFASQFQRLVLWGILLALPFAFIIIYYWIKTFPFVISIFWIISIALMCCLSVFLFSLGVVLLLVYRKALRNPVESLRYE